MKTKRIKLRGWVLVVLKLFLIVNMFFMACVIEDLSLMFYKTLLTTGIIIPISYLLIKYGDL